MSKPRPISAGFDPPCNRLRSASVPLRPVKPSSGGDRQALTWKFPNFPEADFGTRWSEFALKRNLPVSPPLSQSQVRYARLLQQLQDGLLHLVGHPERGQTGGLEDAIPSRSRHRFTDVGAGDAALGAGQVLGLGRHHAAGGLQLVDEGADAAAHGGNQIDGIVGSKQCCLRIGGRQ